MDVALPSGETATFRDVMLRGDIREARRGMVFVTGPDGSRRTDGAFLDDLKGRIIARMFVSWTYPHDLRNAQGEHLQQQILDQLDSDDYAALEDAVDPWVQRVLRMGRTGYRFSHNATGVVFEVTDPGEAQKLAASPDVTMIEDATGPKLPALSATGTGSQALPAPNGQETTTGPTPSTSS
jgi:hypothetical protein